ncbi:MAG: M2.NcuI DNA methyltransferase [Parcubacteria group bacterium GW2011_GWA2_42_28]|nr:MAG: M2.NcuI DNA methyltransferase [Parcubacteria group bacterium GW2011_GWA2_42_28]
MTMLVRPVGGRKDAVRAKSENHFPYLNKVFFKDSKSMKELPPNSVQLIVTSPPYFNIKDYSLDGYQEKKTSERIKGQIGDVTDYHKYIDEMLQIWKECHRVLRPNGKLVINTPLMPMFKKVLNTHHNRHIYNINSDIEHSILANTDFYLLDVFIWNRTNPSKRLMFGSYPFPRNFYAQNTVEFITAYVKDGIPENDVSRSIKQKSRLSEKEWTDFTKQIWDIPIPGKGDMAFGEHSAIMPEEIARRCIRLYTFLDDLVLDPFTGSGTTLKVAKELGRNFVGYEISKSYEPIIRRKLGRT